MSLDLTDDQLTFKYWLGAVRQQTITPANTDQVLCHHMASLGHNELIWRQVWKFPNNDETMIRLSYLYNGSHYIDKTMYPYIKMAPGRLFSKYWNCKNFLFLSQG